MCPAVCQVLHVLMIEIQESPSAPLVPLSPLNQMSVTHTRTQSVRFKSNKVLNYDLALPSILVHYFSVLKTLFFFFFGINCTYKTNMYI